MQDGWIADSQLSASSIANSYHDVIYSRLYNEDTSSSRSAAWCAGTNAVDQWIAVDLLSTTQVTGLITQGRHANAQWVTSYQFQYSDDSNTWNTVTDADGSDEVSD